MLTTTTSYSSFHGSCAIAMGLSGFYKIVNVMKMHFQRKEPKLIQ